MRSLALIRFLLVLAATLGTAALAQQTPRFAGSTTVIAVEIPVNVYRGGEPVRGFSAEDFRVLDDGRERPIVGFEVIDLAMIAQPAGTPAAVSVNSTEVPLSARRHFLLLFDLSFVQRDNLTRAVGSARQLMDGALHPTDLVGLGVFGAGRGAQLLVGFSAKHDHVAAALDALESLLDGKRPDMADDDLPSRRQGRRSDPLRLFLGERPSVAGDVGRFAGVEQTLAVQTLAGGLTDDGGRGAGLLSETLADMDEVSRIELNARKASQALAFTDGLAQLAAATASIEGRKYLVLFSEGFELPTGDVYIGDNSRLLNGMERAADTFRKAGWTIQGVNVGGLDDVRFGSETLLKMATDTGGELYERFNDLGRAMGRMLSKTSVTYLLTIQADGIAIDGAFHRLKVQLVNRPRGARVLHRAGYLAPGADMPEDSGLGRTLALGQKVLAGDEGGNLDVSALAVPVDGRGGLRRVAVWIAADGASLAADQADGWVRADAFVYALDALGEIRDFFTQPIDFEHARVADRLAHGDVQIYGTVAVPPGPTELRIYVRTPSGREAVRRLSIDVPAGTADGASLSPPLFLADAQMPLLIVRSAEPGVDPDDEAEAARRYPFRVGEQTFAPSVRPVVRAGHPQRIVVMAHHLGLDQNDRTVRVRVLRGGAEARGGKLAIAGRSEVRPDGAQQLYLQLDPAALSAGDGYQLEVTVTDTGSGATVASSVQPFVVAARK